MAIITTNTWDSERFWSAPPRLPTGLQLEREHHFWFLERPGPGGSDSVEQVTLRTPSSDLRLLVAYRSPLSAKDVVSLKRRLSAALEERRRDASNEEGRIARWPVVATDRAQPSVREACEREWLGLIDQAGTVLLHEGPVYVHVEGHAPVPSRVRATLYRGKGARALRFLLEAPGLPRSVTETAQAAQLSPAYAFAVLRRLEESGFVERKSPRSGFRLTRAAELLTAWIDERPGTAALVEPFYAPSLMPADLERVQRLLAEKGALSAMTLSGALRDEEVSSGGIPHGIYLTGDARGVVDALRLRKTTPHNFLILRPEPEAATTNFGVFRDARTVVSRPQLILDLAAYGGPRGREQADAVLRRWARDLSRGGAE